MKVGVAAFALALAMGSAPAAAQRGGMIEVSVRVEGGDATLHATFPCRRSRGCPAALSLGDATEARVAHVLDLLGEGFERLPGQGSSRIAPSGHPAALVSVGHEASGRRTTRWLLVSLRRRRPTVVWDFTAHVANPGGGGLSTRDLRMTRVTAGEPVEITLRGEALPSPGDRPFRPGPPIRFQFRMGSDGTYQPVR